MADTIKTITKIPWDNLKTVNKIAIASLASLNTIPPCLVKGTKVIMEDGTEVPIENIRPEDRIRTYNLKNKKTSSAKVNWVQEPREVLGYYEIEAEDGTLLKITGEHPIFVMSDDKNGEFIIVKEIKVGQKFLNKENKIVEIKRKEYIKSKATVYNVTIDKFHNYFGAGVLCHNY